MSTKILVTMRMQDIELLAALIYRDIAAYIIDSQEKEKCSDTK